MMRLRVGAVTLLIPRARALELSFVLSSLERLPSLPPLG
ncbi:hypothetical protein HNQ69_001475 [Bartonella callosciuri]|uniref:Uncharacterized protein n=1 Tax=Bartonella callosciuri TaxID=686223 RepID=A0A840P226_9HYPH|nr:hypothetical protein [Bartonella callosciuri]